MATRDLYNILGIDKDATADDVKRAYRVLARRWHPDKNPDDAAADAHFKDVQEAYRTLSDVEKRQRYDKLGPLYTEDGRPPRPEDLNAVASTVWGNLFRWRSVSRGEDLRYTLTVTLEEVVAGCDKEVTVPRQVRCRTCAGEGATPAGRATCTVCKGSGRGTGPLLLRTDCYHCKGRGYTVETPCPDCRGDGRVGVEDALRVKVPAGVTTGQKLKIVGKGNAPRGSGDAGDLLVIVSVTEHALFRRRGEDVMVELPLTFAELALGAEVVVPTLEGHTTIRIPPGSPAGKVLRLGSRGLPRVGAGARGSRGDLHVQLVLEVPPALDEAQQQALRQLFQTLPATTHPRRATFQQQVAVRG